MPFTPRNKFQGYKLKRAKAGLYRNQPALAGLSF